MFLNFTFKTTVALIALGLIAAPTVAQKTDAEPKVAKKTVENSWLSAEGKLEGNIVLASHNETVTAADAQVSLVSKGKVIDSVKADAAGNFSFANVEPGPYQIVGHSGPMVGSQSVNVAPFAPSQPVQPNQVVLQQGSPVSMETWGEAPVSSMSSPVPAGQPSFGFPGGRGFGGGGIASGGGGIGRRLLTTPRGLLIVGGIAGGLAAIDDSSPDE